MRTEYISLCSLYGLSDECPLMYGSVVLTSWSTLAGVSFSWEPFLDAGLWRLHTCFFFYEDHTCLSSTHVPFLLWRLHTCFFFYQDYTFEWCWSLKATYGLFLLWRLHTCFFFYEDYTCAFSSKETTHVLFLLLKLHIWMMLVYEGYTRAFL